MALILKSVKTVHMKKSGTLLLFFAFVFQISSAQTFVAQGTVGNQEGLPLRYAFVYDKESKNATYTDSLGQFRLTVKKNAQLTISDKGYDESTVTAGDGHLNVTLKKSAAASGKGESDADVKAVEDAFKPIHDQLTGPGISSFGAQTFNNVKETVGSQFLFKQWVHGYIVKMNGDVIQTPALLLNYNKMTGDLFMTENLTSVMTGDKNTIRSFVIVGPDDVQYTFEMMTGISTDHYCQVISAGPKYKIYKLIKTKFIPSNYKTDGVYSTGNTYDEYADNYDYYVINLTTTAFQPLPLNKKSIKAIFAAEGTKAEDFVAAHKIKENDAWVKSFGDAMNQ